ncbi:perlucin-like [Haliotis asinina]|uniref:perlucin-like n=1 Tax=Haliotis asinina TaxID=109174 RepID=UPI00353243AB
MSLGLVFVLLCALAPVTAAKDTPRCPEGFLERGSSCYWFSLPDGTFAEARSYCQFFGSHLARIKSEDENDFITRHAKTKNGSPGYWVGATDLMTDGKFMWEGGSPLNYTNWSPGQPDDDKTTPRRATQNCLMLQKTENYMWNDYPCTEKVNFICERRASTCCCKI